MQMARKLFIRLSVWLALRKKFEPRRKKTCLRGFRPDQTQTGLYNHRKPLEARDFGYKSKVYYMSHVMGKPDFCICENKDADQLRGNREADQRLCFRHIDSTIYLLPKYGSL